MEIKCQLDATDDFYCRSYCLLNMFRAPLCPSSGAREYYTEGCCLWYLVLWFSSCRYGVELRVMCPVCGLLQQPANRTHNPHITTVTTGQINICSENAVWPPEDRHKGAQNMLRNNWLTIKSLIVASSWSHIYLLMVSSFWYYKFLGCVMLHSLLSTLAGTARFFCVLEVIYVFLIYINWKFVSAEMYCRKI